MPAPNKILFYRRPILSALLNTARYLNNSGVFRLLFHRNGLFNVASTDIASDPDKMGKNYLDWVKETPQFFEESQKLFEELHPFHTHQGVLNSLQQEPPSSFPIPSSSIESSSPKTTTASA